MCMCMCMCTCMCMCMCMCMRKCVCVCRNWKLEDIFCILKLTMDNRKWNEIRIENSMQSRFENKRKAFKFESPGLVWRSWATPLASRWPKMRVGSHLGLNLETSWGSSCRQDGPSWAKMTPLWRYVGQLGPQDTNLPHWAILDDVGSKMVSFGLSWAMLWDLGAKMANKSAKTRQDRRK